MDSPEGIRVKFAVIYIIKHVKIPSYKVTTIIFILFERETKLRVAWGEGLTPGDSDRGL
jgi:hypothetical protein